MRQNFSRALAILAVLGLSIGAIAQPDPPPGPGRADNEEIIIRKKGDKDTKVTVEIKDGEVTVNGKPLAEFKDDNVVVSKGRGEVRVMGYAAPRSPFRGGTNFGPGDSTFNDLMLKMRLDGLNMNKALLGVVTEKVDNGVKVNSVTKNSSAEKAGLKPDDIITKVDDATVATPEDLTKAIGKFKPEDKVSITYKRDKKEMKANVTLGKREDGATTLFGNDMQRNFNFDFNSPMIEGLRMARGAGPRLGIKAQDTEDGKGVKVIGIDDESNAEKAGIKEGDIITEFDGKAVNSATELADAARDAKDKNLMKLKLNRSGKSQEIELKVPKKLKTANL